MSTVADLFLIGGGGGGGCSYNRALGDLELKILL